MLPFVPWTRPRRSSPPAGAGRQDVPTGGSPDEGTSWVGRLAAGDTAALAELYRREAPAVYRYALALCGNAAWAADATQEAFVALATRPLAFDARRGSVGAYLAGVARHALAAVWRQCRSEQALPQDEDDAAIGGVDEATPETLFVRARLGAEVWQALRELPVPQREAIVLVDLQERPYAEAAQIAGIELNTLRTRLHRARLRLAARLAGGDGSAS